MKLGRIAAVVLLVATVGIMTGSAMAMSVGTPTPRILPVLPSVTYVIGATVPGQPVVFTPFLQQVHSLGLLQVHLLNHNVWPQLYLLQGTPFTVMVMPGVSLTIVVTLEHPGMYVWVAQLPTPATPPGTMVGFLNVVPGP
jgi:hypothetical protein